MGIELSFLGTLGHEILLGIISLCEGWEDIDGEM
jgi:hypothetical protein